MFRYKIAVEYDGSNFVGWQRQRNGLSVSEVIEIAIFKFSGNKVDLFGSGRTDKGVHAISQIAHFDLNKLYEPEKVISAINFYLNNYAVAISDCQLVDADFHARFSAKERHYVYKILNRKSKPILDKNRVWWIRSPLDIEKMRIAASYLEGLHDFSSFRASGCQSSSPVKTINKIVLRQRDDYVEIFVSAPSFLYHMVRNIVGSLVKVGLGQWHPEKIEEILLAKNRSLAAATAPAEGLYFLSTDY